MEGQAPWNMQNKPDVHSGSGNTIKAASIQPQAPPRSSNIDTPKETRPTAHIESKSNEGQKHGHMVMMAHISNVEERDPAKIILSMNTSVFSSIEPDSHYWFVDSAASSHVCGSRDLFESIEDIPPITIETASGDTFKANKRGIVNIAIRSDPSSDLADMQVTLMNVIYVP